MKMRQPMLSDTRRQDAAVPRWRVRGIRTLAVLLATALIMGAGAPASSAQEAISVQVAVEQLAELELDLVVSRDLDQAEARLTELLAGVLASPEAVESPTEVAPVVAQLLARWAAVLLDRGQVDEAAAVLGAGGPTDDGVWSDSGLPLSDPALARLSAMGDALAADARMIEQAARLEALRHEGAGSASSEFVETVRKALENNQNSVLEDLGVRAGPALEALTDLSSDAGAGSSAWSSLFRLLWLEPDRGMRLVQRALDEGLGVNVPAVAYRIRQSNILSRNANWFQSGNQPARLLEPGWRRVVVGFLSPGRFPVGDCSNVVRLVREFAVRDAFTEDLTSAYGDVFFRPEFLVDDSFRKVLLDSILFPDRRTRSLQPLLDRLVTHPHDTVRQRAAASLVHVAHSDALLGRFTDSNVYVRIEVARALGVRKYREWGGDSSQWNHPRMDPPDAAILEHLAADESGLVRFQVATSLASHAATAVDESVYVGLARDADADVRVAMAELVVGDLALRQRILLLLAADEDPRVRLAVAKRHEDPPAVALAVLDMLSADEDGSVRQAVVKSVYARADRGADLVVPSALLERLIRDPDPSVRRQLLGLTVEGPEALVSVLLPLANDASLQVRQSVDYRLAREIHTPSWNGIEQLLLPICRIRLFDDEAGFAAAGGTAFTTLEGRRELIRWTLESDREDLWNQFDHSMTSGDWPEVWLGLNDHELARLFGQLFDRYARGRGGKYSETYGLKMLQVIVSEGAHPRPEVGRHLFADESFPLDVRLMGARMYASEATTEEVNEWIALFASADWSGDLRWLKSWRGPEFLGRYMTDTEHVRFAREMLALNIPEVVIQSVVQGVVSRKHPDAGLLLDVLDRWYSREGEPILCVRFAIQAMARVPEAVDPTLLADAVHSLYSEFAVGTMASLKDERFTEVLGACLTADELKRTRQAAREGLVALMSDAAVEQLLRAAAWTTESYDREKYMEAVAAIQDYQDSLAAWEARKHRVATRDETVRELRTLLASGNPLLRAEAARSLGTLGAVDQLPALIRLLEDEDAGVVAAAQAALDQLHAAATPEVAGDG